MRYGKTFMAFMACRSSLGSLSALRHQGQEDTKMTSLTWTKKGDVLIATDAAQDAFERAQTAFVDGVDIATPNA